MATVTQNKSKRYSERTPLAISQLLHALRQRIRRYVLLEGVAMTLIWLVSAFWLMLAMDYLPVLLGANEMPRAARVVLLTLMIMGTLGVLYWYVLRRVFITFRDASLAILVERQFPGFADSLVTTVQMSGDLKDVAPEDRAAIEGALRSTPDSDTVRMLQDTIQKAEQNVADVNLSRVFNYRPLVMKWGGALVAVASIVLLGLFGGNLLAVGASRLLTLSEKTWPRRAQIEMVGFTNGQRKIAKGTDCVVRVRAEASRQYPPPEVCSILYQTSDGDHGRVNMSRDGDARDGFQYYVFNGKPFNGVLSDIEFDVIGYDHRLRDLRLKVVLSPVVTGIDLVTKLPEYLGQPLPQSSKWNPGVQLPLGSEVTATVYSSKPLIAAGVQDIDSGDEVTFNFDNEPSKSWELDLGTLGGRKALSVTLNDVDGVESLEPHLLTIGGIEDQTPDVDIVLRGIGTAITTRARLPIEGSIADDYQLQRTWFDVQIGDQRREFEFNVPSDSKVNVALDLRDEAAAGRKQPLSLNPQDRVVFAVKASDQFNLDGKKHVGSSENTTLTVVRDDELLAILDGRELGLRRRFEQIRSEMMQSRDSLARLRASFREQVGSDDLEAADSELAIENLAKLRARWAGWARQKGEQSSVEVDGVALAFEDIREELINNRVDTQERLARMEGQIIAPLREISATMFPNWLGSLTRLNERLNNRTLDAESQSVDVVAEADQILVAMDAVLEKMLELEDYAELVSILRQIIEEQEGLTEKTKSEQKARVLDFLD